MRRPREGGGGEAYAQLVRDEGKWAAVFIRFNFGPVGVKRKILLAAVYLSQPSGARIVFVLCVSLDTRITPPPPLLLLFSLVV